MWAHGHTIGSTLEHAKMANQNVPMHASSSRGLHVIAQFAHKKFRRPSGPDFYFILCFVTSRFSWCSHVEINSVAESPLSPKDQATLAPT